MEIQTHRCYNKENRSKRWSMEKIKKTAASENILLKEMQLNGCVTLKEAMKKFGMSEATVRRLFARMEEKGLGSYYRLT